MPEQIVTRPERPEDAPSVQALQRGAFGPGAYARAAFRVREEAGHAPELSFVMERDGNLIGSVRQTRIRIGETPGLLLGPLVIDPCCKGRGYGATLIAQALAAAKESRSAFVLLVGDEPYYGRFGFKPIPAGRVRMSSPVDPARLLVAELRPAAARELSGIVRGADC